MGTVFARLSVVCTPRRPDVFESTLKEALFARAIVAMQNVPRDALTAADIPTKTIPEVKSSLARTLEARHAELDPSESYLARWQAWLNTVAEALVRASLAPGIAGGEGNGAGKGNGGTGRARAKAWCITRHFAWNAGQD